MRPANEELLSGKSLPFKVSPNNYIYRKQFFFYEASSHVWKKKKFFAFVKYIFKHPNHLGELDTSHKINLFFKKFFYFFIFFLLTYIFFFWPIVAGICTWTLKKKSGDLFNYKDHFFTISLSFICFTYVFQREYAW